MENFSIPSVGALIIKKEQDRTFLLLQERWKNIPEEDGLIEMTAGKIRAFESIFDTLKREVKEECGLTITKIHTGNIEIIEVPSYKVQNFTPYYSVQNVTGNYPIMMDVFLCEATGELLEETNESKNIAWMDVVQVRKLLNTPDKFYAMHIGAIKKIVTELS